MTTKRVPENGDEISLLTIDGVWVSFLVYWISDNVAVLEGFNQSEVVTKDYLMKMLEKGGKQ